MLRKGRKINTWGKRTEINENRMAHSKSEIRKFQRWKNRDSRTLGHVIKDSNTLGVPRTWVSISSVKFRGFLTLWKSQVSGTPKLTLQKDRIFAGWIIHRTLTCVCITRFWEAFCTIHNPRQRILNSMRISKTRNVHVSKIRDCTHTIIHVIIGVPQT